MLAGEGCRWAEPGEGLPELAPCIRALLPPLHAAGHAGPTRPTDRKVSAPLFPFELACRLASRHGARPAFCSAPSPFHGALPQVAMSRQVQQAVNVWQSSAASSMAGGAANSAGQGRASDRGRPAGTGAAFASLLCRLPGRSRPLRLQPPALRPVLPPVHAAAGLAAVAHCATPAAASQAACCAAAGGSTHAWRAGRGRRLWHCLCAS